MTDAEMQRLAAMITDEVCQRADEQIETLCYNAIYVVIAFWVTIFIARVAFLFWQALRKEMQK
jgi:hypothetical protein